MPPMGVLARTVSSAASSQVVSVSLVMNTRHRHAGEHAAPELVGLDGLECDDETRDRRFSVAMSPVSGVRLWNVRSWSSSPGSTSTPVIASAWYGSISSPESLRTSTMPPLGRLDERARDGFAASLTPAQIDRRIDERVVRRPRGGLEWITGSDFAEVVRHG